MDQLLTTDRALLIAAEKQVTYGSWWALRGHKAEDILQPAFTALLKDKAIKIKRSGQVRLTSRGMHRVASIRIEN